MPVEQQPVLDCLGQEITVGATVVVAVADRRLQERTVRALERPGAPDWWVNVHFDDGGYTTPDRIAVIPAAGHGDT